MRAVRGVSAVLVLLALAAPCVAFPTTYVGGLTSNPVSSDPNIAADALYGTGFWISPGHTTLVWEISRILDTDPWHYSYTFTTPGPGGAPSHFILETSDPFSYAWPDLFNATGDFGTVVVSLNSGYPGQLTGGNPYMPEDLWGAKFDSLSGAIVVDIDFDSWRDPVWGDFYAKCGRTGPLRIQNTAWNKGFTVADPTAPASNGALSNHILRPDGLSQPIPEPGTVGMMGLGLLAIFGYGWRTRRRRDQAS